MQVTSAALLASPLVAVGLLGGIEFGRSFELLIMSWSRGSGGASSGKDGQDCKGRGGGLRDECDGASTGLGEAPATHASPKQRKDVHFEEGCNGGGRMEDRIVCLD